MEEAAGGGLDQAQNIPTYPPDGWLMLRDGTFSEITMGSKSPPIPAKNPLCPHHRRPGGNIAGYRSVHPYHGITNNGLAIHHIAKRRVCQLKLSRKKGACDFTQSQLN
jgi:hypothetical protein